MGRQKIGECMNKECFVKKGTSQSAALYPAHRHCGVTNAAADTPSLVIPEICSPGYSEGRKSGFTLLELLVVVLIIGILASIALPQYRKAVERSKSAQAITLLKSVYQAAKAYQLANGNWPEDFNSLALDIPFTGHVNAARATGGHFKPGLSNEDWSIQLQAPMAIESVANGSGVFITRISGPYAGGAFAIYAKWPTRTTNLPPDQIVCKESTHPSDYAEVGKFKKNYGDYCRKILKGTPIGSGSADHYFALP